MTSSVDEAKMMLARMDKSNELAVDTEATGLNCKGNADYAMGIAIADEHGQSVYLPFRHPLEPDDNLPREFLPTVLDFLSQQRRTLMWHNIKFDYQAMHTWGVDIRQWACTHIDTMIEMYLLNEEFPSYELDFLGQRFLKKGKVKLVADWANIHGWHTITPRMMDKYARNDVADLTQPLHQLFKPELEQRGLYDLAKTKTLFAMHLGEMERLGVGVNESFCEDMATRGERAMEILHQKLGFNPASSNELGDYLLNVLQLPVKKRSEKTGKPSFDKEVMQKYMTMLEEVNDDSARHILDYRGWQKATSSLYLPMLRKRDADGRVRTEFRQARTVTGRLASANPNLQQIPRWTSKPWNGRAKQSFTSGTSDFDLVGYDYSQLELRLGAAYGNELGLIAEFQKDDADPFRLLAVDLFGEFTDDNRYKAKTFTYATNYGAGKAKVASQLGVTRAVVDEIYDRYHERYTGIFTASKEIERKAKSRGYIKYWTGRLRHCRFESKAYKMWNSTLQGGAAELVERSMLRAPNDENCRQVLQVHDEIVFAIRKGMRDKYEPAILDAMTNWPQFNVRLTVDGKEWNAHE